MSDDVRPERPELRLSDDPTDLTIPAFLIIPDDVRRAGWIGVRHTPVKHVGNKTGGLDLPRSLEPAALEILKEQARKVRPNKRAHRKLKAKVARLQRKLEHRPA